MSYLILCDSCTHSFTDAMEKDPHFPYSINTSYRGGYCDDETFDQASFLRRVAEYHNASKSSCPSPKKNLVEKADEDLYLCTFRPFEWLF